jgi:DNA-directed RNA polymerase specialized sigma24 family protein
MEPAKSKWRILPQAPDSGRLLEEYYARLRKWGLVLTRGDRAMAEEIVQDLCLYFTVSRPDLSQVANLDGYLYTCLRHIYLSALGRSSREALQTVDIADFDSIRFALSMRTPDSLLDRQNELRRICNYAVWRKEYSKSASYFILHFFHGYARREIAEIACLPIAAIYNKLKAARDEVKSYLGASGKLRIATRELPPEPELLLSPIPSPQLFDDLQRTIFESISSECLSEEDLLNHYQLESPAPIPCSLLSHIVSCKGCLAVIDRHFQRPSGEDREPPDDVWTSIDRNDSSPASQDTKSFKSLMRVIRWQREGVFDHRPRTLSIAVDGKITAFHDVQGERSTLAVRIEKPEGAQFVEVFTDQQIRLAMLPIAEHPPEGPHSLAQRVTLSDDRWLNLELSFDGQGIHSEVTYFDPTLAVRIVEEEADEVLPAVKIKPSTEWLPIPIANTRSESVFTRIARYLRPMTLRPAFAWTMLLAIVLGSTGYLMYRRYSPAPENANEALNRSIQMETAGLKGETEHQVLTIDANGADGQSLWQGTVDVWKESDTGRTLRRLYDAKRKPVAEAWRAIDGRSGSALESSRTDMSDADREIAESGVWQEDVSARAFHEIAGRDMQVRHAGENYELSSAEVTNAHLRLVSATLILDHRLHVVGETLRVSGGSRIREVRFVQTNYERHPSSSVPAKVFEPADLDSDSTGDGRSSISNRFSNQTLFGADIRLVQLQIAVLYELNELGADTGEPIEVTRTSDGHIRVSGTVSDEARKRAIKGGLEALADHQLLDLRLESQGNLRIPRADLQRATQLASKTYSVAQTEAPVDALLQKYFASQGWTGERTNSATAEFSQNVLRQSQRALQHAYALDRLGAQFTPGELQAAGQASDRLWAEMAKRHAAALESELRELRAELLLFEPAKAQALNAGKVSVSMESPADFALAAREILRETQSLNRYIGEAFTTSLAVKEQRNPEQMISDAISAIPTQDAGKIAAFATRLSSSESASTTPMKRGNDE